MRYKPILQNKIEIEERKEEQQKALQERVGISDKTVKLKERGAKGYLWLIVKGIGYFIFVAMIFLGIVTILYPETRNLLLEFV